MSGPPTPCGGPFSSFLAALSQRSFFSSEACTLSSSGETGATYAAVSSLLSRVRSSFFACSPPLALRTAQFWSGNLPCCCLLISARAAVRPPNALPERVAEPLSLFCTRSVSERFLGRLSRPQFFFKTPLRPLVSSRHLFRRFSGFSQRRPRRRFSRRETTTRTARRSLDHVPFGG